MDRMKELWDSNKNKKTKKKMYFLGYTQWKIYSLIGTGTGVK
jgi:hypothetical protein